MKQLLIIIFVFGIHSTVSAQYERTDSIVSYSEVVIIDSATKDELFIKARQWVNELFKDSKSVLQIVDKESGELAGKGILSSWYWFKFMGKEKKQLIDYNFTMEIFVKDGKYKFQFSNFKPVDGNSSAVHSVLTSSKECPEKIPMFKKTTADKMWVSMQSELDKTMTPVVISLKETMNAKKSKTDF